MHSDIPSLIFSLIFSLIGFLNLHPLPAFLTSERVPALDVAVLNIMVEIIQVLEKILLLEFLARFLLLVGYGIR